jgi:simple sugar transport system substrate-binding protein/ribose transport system substrate-binding protein
MMTSALQRRAAVLAAVLLTAALAGCSRDGEGATGAAVPVAPASGPASVGVDLPRSDSDFWNAFARYVPERADSLGVSLVGPTNSQNEVQKVISNIDSLVTQGAGALVISPQDTGAIGPKLDELADRGIPVVSVDTRPDTGRVYMVVRADNRAYGTKACEFLGEQLGGTGKVVEFQGALSSINGRDRSEAFKECMTTKFPGITVFEEPTDWEGTKAQAALETRLATDPDINGIYMQAGGCSSTPRCRCCASATCSCRPTTSATSPSCPTTASRRSSRRSGTGRSTRRCRSRPTSTRSTACTGRSRRSRA